MNSCKKQVFVRILTSNVENVYSLIIILYYELKSDTVAVLVILPRYRWYYRKNGYYFFGITWYWAKIRGIPVGMGTSPVALPCHGVGLFSHT